MPKARIIIDETLNGCTLSIKDVRDINHAHRILLQALFPTTHEDTLEMEPPVAKLALLRSFLVSVGASNPKTAQRLLILGLFQIVDELEERRVAYFPEPMTSRIL